MSLFRPFKKIVREAKNPYEIEHQGTVIFNEDPKKLGRVQVSIKMWEDLDDDLLPWCTPELPNFLGNNKQNLMLSIPEVGTDVTVFFPNKDKNNPAYKGTYLTNLNVNKENVLFENYPQTYGWVDSILNFFKVNKTKKEIIFQHSSGTNIKIIENGNIKATHANGSYVEITEDYTKLEHSLGSKVTLDDYGEIIVQSKKGSTYKFRDSGLEIKAPSLFIDGKLGASTGKSATIVCGSNVLIFENGILVQVL